MATSTGCVLHGYHWPSPLVLVVHHVQPLGMGGPNTPANRRKVCDTGHRNVHKILAWLVFGRAGSDPLGTRKERALAQEGYDAWVAAGKPGNPHAAYALVREH